MNTINIQRRQDHLAIPEDRETSLAMYIILIASWRCFIYTNSLTNNSITLKKCEISTRTKTTVYIWHLSSPSIVFVWMQYKGTNMNNRTKNDGWCQNKNYVVGTTCWSSKWVYNTCSCTIIFSIVLTSE